MNYGNKLAQVPEDIKMLIDNIVNIIKNAKEKETIMCNVDIEDCLVKGKTEIFGKYNKIDEGVLGVLELIKKEAEKKGVNFIMNFNSVAQLHNNLDRMFAAIEEQAKLKRLYALNKDKTIKRIGQSNLDHDNKKALTIDSFSCDGNYIKTDKDYKDKIIQYGRLQKHKVNELYLEGFRQETKNTEKVYVFHFDNEVSYFEAKNEYSDTAYQFLSVPIKCAKYEYIDYKNNTQNGHQQNTEGAFLSTDVLVELENILNEDKKAQLVNIEARKRRHEKIRLKQKQERFEQKELYIINLEIQDIIKNCNLNPEYQTDYEFAKELLINECKETIAMCQKAIDHNKQGLKNIDNAYPEMTQRDFTIPALNKTHQEKIKVFGQNRSKDIEENKKNREEQIQNNERYIEEKNKEIEQIKNIKSTATKSGASDKYLKEAIFYLHRYINGDQYEATYRLDKYGVLINVNQNYDKDLMINKLDTNTIKNILLKLKLCQQNQYAINDHIVKLIIYDLRQIEIDNAKGRY